MQFTSSKFQVYFVQNIQTGCNSCRASNCTKQGRYFTESLTSDNPILNEEITKRNLQKETALTCFQSKANTKENLIIFLLIIAKLLNFVK